MSQGLLSASTADLKKLCSSLERGTLRAPLTKAKLRAAGLGRLAEHLGVLGGLEGPVLTGWLKCLLAEREAQKGARLELVWTGPDLPQTVVRDTARVVRDLFERAEKSVLVGGCYFTQGEAILKPLYKAIRDRGVEVIFCLNILGEASSLEAVPEHVGKQVRKFIGSNWPFGKPLPRFFYDPRTAAPGGKMIKLHSKCIVVDERHTFISSANFTFLGQRQNIETGVQIEDEGFAKELSGHWQSLIGAGLLHEYEVKTSDLKRCKLDVRCEEWERERGEVEEEYWPLFDSLKTLGLIAPDDIAELQWKGRTTGESAICSWGNDGRPFALVRPGHRADNLVALEVSVDAEPEQVAAAVREQLEVA